MTAQQFHTNEGITLEESKQVAQWLEEAGCAALNVSADFHQSAMRMPWKVEGEKFPRPPMAHPHGFLIPLAAEIKKVVNIPVMAIGWIDTETGEKALREGKIDMVVMGRPLLADPEIPNKVAAGKLDDIRPCIGCLMCQVDIDKAIKCTVNAGVSRELDYPITATKKKKRIAVIGGGPAGLEAARVASLRGHEVILYEKDTKLGGQLYVATRPLHKEVINNLIRYLTRQVNQLGVKVELGKEATADMVLSAKPDAVIVATGVLPCVLKIPGIENDMVVEAADVLTEQVQTGDTVVIIGGGVVGLETAEFLADKGKRVTVVEMLPELAAGMERWHKQYLLERLNTLGVIILTKAKAEAVQQEGMMLTTEDGEKLLLPANTIVSCTGARSNKTLYQELSGKVQEIYCIGDSAEPRRILEATAEGFLTGQAI
jgi:NADPH-dependent 2,4-dienoyl-CoA reductase/sulfur reductase-like enzyme